VKVLSALRPALPDAAMAAGAAPADNVQALRKGERGGLVLEAIKTAIRDGKLRPGQRLREIELAESLGVSRTPVREALKMLEAQGLVSSAIDGLVVKTLSPQETTELYTAWAELEAVAARQAAMHAKPSDVRLMRTLCEQWSPELPPQQLGSINHMLHQAIYAASYNSFLHRALDAIDNSVTLLGLQTYTDAQRRQSAGAEHLAIVEAIARRDPEAAAAAASGHIEESEKIRFHLVGQQRPSTPESPQP
jgi:DNA-binding GntR family transcriptional regulator